MTVIFTVYFEPPFWVGILELHDVNESRAARHIFGTEEPTQPEVWLFMQHDYGILSHEASKGSPFTERAISSASRNSRRDTKAKHAQEGIHQSVRAALMHDLYARRENHKQSTRLAEKQHAKRKRQLHILKIKRKKRGR